jgi:hypothetical protein
MNNIIHGYVRKGQKKVGIVVAALNPQNENEILISGSLCHRNDAFDKNKGLSMAKQRALTVAQERCAKVPYSLKYPMFLMEKRAFKYFGQANTVKYSPCFCPDEIPF